MSQPTFDRRTTRRIPGARAVVVLREGARPCPLHDLSLQGLAVSANQAAAEGEALELELVHPRLGALRLEAVVRWCKLVGEGKRPRVGLELTRVGPRERSFLRRLMAAEAGSCVLADNEVLAFLLTVSQGSLWSLLDERATRLATIQRDEQGRLLVAARGSDPCGPPRHAQATSLEGAISELLGLRAAPRFEPGVPLQPPPPSDAFARGGLTPPAPPPPPPAAEAPAAKPEPQPEPQPEPKPEPKPEPESPREAAPTPQPRARPKPKPKPKPRHSLPNPLERQRAAEVKSQPLRGHCVRDSQRRIVGYAALTGDSVWSLYDEAIEQIGVLQQAGGRYTVYWLGDTPESSTVAVDAESFPAALSVAFEIDSLPELSHTVITPGERSIEVPEVTSRSGPGSRVLFRKRVLGYVAEGAMENAWAILNKEAEQIALLARDTFPPYSFRLCHLGATADESMEFDIHVSLLDAVAGAFDLPGPPLLDPPLDL